MGRRSDLAKSLEENPHQANLALQGELQLGLAGQGNLRWAAVDVTQPLEEARQRLDLSPIAAVALGRALAAAALLLRFYSKNPGGLLFEVIGDGPLGRVVAEVDHNGAIRGLVGKPHLETPENGCLGISWAIGKGFLRVTREGRDSRYSSQVELVSGEIGKDLAHYLETSEQIRSAALLGVLPRPDGIGAAGGFLVEALPGTDEDVIAHLEQNVADLAGVSHYLARGGVQSLRDAVLSGFDREELERYPLTYLCRCNRDELLAKLQNLVAAEVDQVVGEDGRCVAICAFCGEHYIFTRGELLTN